MCYNVFHLGLWTVESLDTDIAILSKVGAKLTARHSVEPIPPSFEPSKAGSRPKVSQHLDRPFYTKPYCSYYVRVSTPQECSTKNKESVKNLSYLQHLAGLIAAAASQATWGNAKEHQRQGAGKLRRCCLLSSLLFKKKHCESWFYWPTLARVCLTAGGGSPRA